ncbi:MAG TPA: hypothetical protein PK637_00630 [Flavobacteriales bacterium]|nr:hypothetical protein [Flavobacteriales bacterium]HRE73695.1 hypothetical protein [Flavobacteriales bacterium]HRE95236.1 hypothetical protein [Flavobacteriales bacterium]HRJ35816.1 hypothetical protein [Flavobacteriales bacterium]HRJ37172.1 hypothetical protein [Flavobacteriales bacterium]
MFDEDFNDDYFSGYEAKNLEESIRKHPLYLQAKNLHDVCGSITELLNGAEAEFSKRELQESGLVILSKTYAMLTIDSKLLRLVEASVLRMYAERIRISSLELKMFNRVDLQYSTLLRTELELYRAHFLDLMKETHDMSCEEDFEDDWGVIKC